MIKSLLIFFILCFTVTAQVIDTSRIILSDSTLRGSIKPDSIFHYDSLTTITTPDSLIPIYSSVLSEKSAILANKDIFFTDYKYSGDFLRLFPFNHTKDLGFTGQPNETFLYGTGNPATNYLIDGVLLNDRLTNNFNLNLMQSEDIDSIEIIPLPRGFLSDAFNRPVSVNFITKDFISPLPYSRIRFYQGADRDMMLDGSFNAIVMNKMVASFSVTNRIYDGNYTNTAFSVWQGKIKLKYILSNKINLLATYNYNDYTAGYSGGVNVDSIKYAGNNINDVLYDFRAAPVLFTEGELKTLSHFPKLRLFVRPLEWLFQDISFYYLFARNELNIISREYSENNTYGIKIHNEATYDVFRFRLNADFERTNSFISRTFYDNAVFQTVVQNKDIYSDIFSVSGELSALINNGSIIPSVFYKASSIKRDVIDPLSQSPEGNYLEHGIGLDISVKTAQHLDLYFGASAFDKYLQSKFNNTFIEAGGKYSGDLLSVVLRYFINNYNYNIYTGGVFYNQISFGKLSGIGFNLKLNFSALLFESSSSIYFSLQDKLIGVPKIATITGLYYKSLLFQDNLDLKTGFVLHYADKNNVFTQENGLLAVPSSLRLDFTLIGEIQKTAIVYFTWQNLFNNNYFITPYYPMPSRNIRFGVAWVMFN